MGGGGHWISVDDFRIGRNPVHEMRGVTTPNVRGEEFWNLHCGGAA